MSTNAFRAWFASNCADVTHFTADELLVKGADHHNPNKPGYGLNTDPPEEYWENIAQTARMLQAIRERFRAPIRLHSVYRSPAYNEAIGGARASYHMQGLAADFIVVGHAPEDVAATVRDLRDAGHWRGGVGNYDTFVHSDCRGTNIDFDYRNGPRPAGQIIGPREAGYSSGVFHADVERLQQLLRDRGYPEVGNIDGKFGDRTLGALNRFRAVNGLTTHNTSTVTEEDWAALARVEPPPVSAERASVTASDLAREGSRTVNGANGAIVATGTSTAIGIGGAVAQAINDAAQPVTDVINTVTPHITTAQRILGLVGDLWWLVAIPIAGFAIWQMVKVIRARVDDQRTGRHA